MCEPLYRELVGELGDPGQISREVDEWLIRWHLAQQESGRRGDDG